MARGASRRSSGESLSCCAWRDTTSGLSRTSRISARTGRGLARDRGHHVRSSGSGEERGRLRRPARRVRRRRARATRGETRLAPAPPAAACVRREPHAPIVELPVRCLRIASSRSCASRTSAIDARASRRARASAPASVWKRSRIVRSWLPRRRRARAGRGGPPARSSSAAIRERGRRSAARARATTSRSPRPSTAGHPRLDRRTEDGADGAAARRRRGRVRRPSVRGGRGRGGSPSCSARSARCAPRSASAAATSAERAVASATATPSAGEQRARGPDRHRSCRLVGGACAGGAASGFWARGAAPALRELGEPCVDVVGDPVRVPPLDGIDVDAVDHHAEVEVVAAGEAGLAGLPDRVAARDRRVRRRRWSCSGGRRALKSPRPWSRTTVVP